jgi:anti-anti-sigma factor
MPETHGPTRPRTEVYCLTDEQPLRIFPVGDVDLSSKAQLDAALETIAAAAPGDVVVDLSATTFLDSTGLGFLVRLNRQVHSTGHRVTLTEPRGSVARVLELSGLDRVVTVARRTGPRP